MGNIFKNSFAGFGQELLNGIRTNAKEHISEERFDEMIIGIEKATAAMIDAGLDSKVIIHMLQKYWDLRLSEAESFVESCQRKR